MFFRGKKRQVTIDEMMVQIAVLCDRMAHVIFRHPPVREIEVLEVVGYKTLINSVTVKVTLGPVETEERAVTINFFALVGYIDTVETEGKRYQVAGVSNRPGAAEGVMELEEVPA